MADAPNTPAPSADPLEAAVSAVNQDPTAGASPAPASGGSSGGGSVAAPSPEPSGGSTPKASAAESFGWGAAAGATLNFLDEGGAVVDSLLPNSIAGDGDRGNIYNNDKGLAANIAENYAKNHAILAGAETDHPVASFGGQLLGGLAIPGLGAERSFGSFVKYGMGTGAVSGIGHGDGITDRATQGVEGLAAGGVLSGALYGAGKLVGKGLSFLTGKPVEETAPGAAPARPAMDPAVASDLQGKFDAGATKEELMAALPRGSGLNEKQLDTAITYRDAGGKGARFVPKADTPPTQKVVGWSTDRATGERVPIMADTPNIGPKTMAMDGKPADSVTSANLPTPANEEAANDTSREAVINALDGAKGPGAEALQARLQAEERTEWDQSRQVESEPLRQQTRDRLKDILTANPDDAQWIEDNLISRVGQRKLKGRGVYTPDEIVAQVQDAWQPQAKVPETADQLGAFQQEVQATKARLSGDSSAADIPASSPQGAFRLGNMGDDAASTLAPLIPTNTPKVARSDAELMDTARQAAAEIGQDPEALLAWGKSVAGNLGNADDAMATFRVAWGSAAKEVNDVHMANIDWASAEPELVTSAAESIRNLSVLSQDMQKAKTGLGRALRAIQLPSAEDYAKAIQEAAKPIDPEAPPVQAGPGTDRPLPETKDQIRSWFDMYNEVKDDPKRLNQFLQDALTVPSGSKYLRTSFANMFTANILSAPRTALLNVTGPALINTIRGMERMTGAGAMALNPFISAEQRASALAVAKATPMAYMRTLGDMGDIFRQAWKAASENHSVIGGGYSSPVMQAHYGPLTENLLNAANVDPNWMYSLGNLVNVFPKNFARVNNGLDEFAKRLAYNNDLRANALVEAAQRGLTGDDAWQHVADAMHNGYDAVGAATNQQLLASAERTTFTSTPGPEGSWLRRISQGMIALRQDIPELRYIMPVFNVPANALGATLEHTPLAWLPGISKNIGFSDHISQLNGEQGAVAQAEAHGRMLMGAAFLGAGYMLNRAGMLTGAGPQQKTDRSNWLAAGYQPYSVRMGDEWVSFNKLDILGSMLQIPATMADATTHRPTDETTGHMALAATGALAQWFLDQSALRNAAGLLNMGSDPTNSVANVGGAMADGVLSGMIPASGLLKAGVNATDPHIRLKTGWEDYMKATIPGLSNTLEPVRNVLGEPVNRASDTFAEQFSPVTFSPNVTFKDDPVTTELAHVYQATGYGPGADPAALSYGHYNPKEIKLEDGTSLYTHAMRARQDFQINGQTLREALGDLFSSDRYAAGVDGKAGPAMTSLGDEVRETMIQHVFDQYNKGIKAQLSQESPTALRYLAAAEALQKDNAYLGGLTADDLANNPKLYAARGLDGQAYADHISGGQATLQPPGN